MTIDGPRMTVRAIGEGAGDVSDIARKTPDGSAVSGPIEVTSD